MFWWQPFFVANPKDSLRIPLHSPHHLCLSLYTLCLYVSMHLFRIFWFNVDGLPGGVSGGSVSGLEERLQHMEEFLARFGVGPIRVSKIILRTV